MKIKTNELSDVALDWAVAKAVGHIDDFNSWLHEASLTDIAESGNYHPSEDWLIAGPIIERERIELTNWGMDGWKADATEYTFLGTPQEMEEFATQYGDTALIAAMRCYVASKLGDEVELPDRK